MLLRTAATLRCYKELMNLQVSQLVILPCLPWVFGQPAYDTKLCHPAHNGVAQRSCLTHHVVCIRLAQPRYKTMRSRYSVVRTRHISVIVAHTMLVHRASYNGYQNPRSGALSQSQREKKEALRQGQPKPRWRGPVNLQHTDDQCQ